MRNVVTNFEGVMDLRGTRPGRKPVREEQVSATGKVTDEIRR